MSETDTTNSVYEETITKETSHDEGNRILHHQSTSGTQGKKARQKNPGWHQRRQDQRVSREPRST